MGRFARAPRQSPPGGRVGSFHVLRGGRHLDSIVESIIQQAGVGLCLVGADDRVLFANQEWMRGLGLQNEEVIGRTLVEVVHGHADLCARVRAGETVVLSLHPHVIGGVESWWEGRAAPIALDGGTGTLISGRDVTHRVRVERERDRLLEELSAERARLRAVVDQMPAAIVVAGAPSGEVVLVNRFAAEHIGDPSSPPPTFGIGPGTLPLRPDGQRYSWQEWPIWRSLRDGEVVREQEVQLVRPDGAREHHLVSIAPVRDERGRITGAVAVGVDVTERKRQEQERERLIAELDAILGSIPAGLLVYGPKGRVVRMNDGAASLLGYREDDRYLAPRERFALLDARHPDGSAYEPGDNPVERALRGESVRGELVIFHHRDPKRPLWTSLSIEPVRTRDGGIAGHVASLTDLTPIRLLQERLEDLVRMITHDLRTPLSSVTTLAQSLLRRPESGERLSRRIEGILTSARRMASMLEDLSDLARAESGQLKLQKRPTDLRSFVEEMLERVGDALEAERVVMQVPEGLPAALVDPARLERILLNLISNGLKYSAAPKPVTIFGRSEPGMVVLSVSDSGQGMTEQELGKIFSRYFRSERVRATEGMGLGLYITRILAEAHGGRISVHSELGKGSIFEVQLPRADAVSQARGEAAASAAPPELGLE